MSMLFSKAEVAVQKAEGAVHKAEGAVQKVVHVPMLDPGVAKDMLRNQASVTSKSHR